VEIGEKVTVAHGNPLSSRCSLDVPLSAPTALLYLAYPIKPS
jgi:hypothetical protein